MLAACAAHVLHQEAWKRTTSTFLPMSERESKGSPPVMRGTRIAGAAGAGVAGAGAKRKAATAREARKRVTAHSIPADGGPECERFERSRAQLVGQSGTRHGLRPLRSDVEVAPAGRVWRGLERAVLRRGLAGRVLAGPL